MDINKGFKVADAYIDVHTKDSTSEDRNRISRKNEKWAKEDGKKTGDTWIKSFGRGLLSGMRVLGGMLLKTAIYGTIVGVLGGVVSALAGYVVQLYAALSQLAVALWHSLGIFALLPGAIFAGITALLTFKLALSGVGEALKAGWAGDVGKLNEAMKKLSPNAREAVREIIRLKPALDGLKRAVQDSVFAGMGGTIKQLGAGFLPVLQRGLVAVGTGLNHILHNIGFGLLDSVSSLESALGHVGGLLQGIGEGLRPLIAGMMHFLDITLQVMNVGKVDNWLTTWGEKLSALTSADVQDWVSRSIAMMKLLWGLLKDIGGIFAGLSRAAGDTKFGIFGWFEKIHIWIDDNQPLLTTLFGALKTAADALSPALYELMRQLSTLLISFSGLMVAIGPTLETLFSILGGALNQLIGPLTPFIVTLGQVINAALPGVKILLEFALAMVTGLGTGLIPLLEGIAPALQPLVRIGTVLGTAFGALLVQLTPLVVTLLEQLLPVLAELAPIILQAIVAQIPAWQLLIPLITQLIGELLPELLPLLPSLIDLFTVFSVVTLKVATLIMPPLIAVLTWLLEEVLIPLVQIGLMPLIAIFDWLNEKDFGPLGESLAAPFKAAWHAVEDLVVNVRTWFKELPDKIREWLPDPLRILYDAGHNMIQGLIDGATNLLSRMGQFLLDKLPGWLVDPFKRALGIHSPSTVFAEIGRNTILGYIEGLESQVPRLQDMLTGIAFSLPDELNATLQAGVVRMQMNQPTPVWNIGVNIGNEPITDMVEATIERVPQTVYRAADEGRRRVGYRDPTRRYQGARG